MSIAIEQGSVLFVKEYTIFEIDAPAEIGWVAEPGLYRVLLRGVAVGAYDSQ
jgi:hypothetical protein